jgi:hypothetical protein
MYLQKVDKNQKKLEEKKLFCWLLEGHGRKQQDPDRDP